MHANRPDVTDEELGIRAYRIKQAKAVERAMQLVRHGLADQWSSLTEEEIEELEWVLGEVWSFVTRQEWDELPFGHLGIRDIIKMLTLGSQMRRHVRPGSDVLREITAIIEEYKAQAEADAQL